MKTIRYRGRRTREIRFPLGGIGSGCISLDGTGHLVDWELFNHPAKGTRNGYSGLYVKAESEGQVLDARVLQGDVAPPYSGTGGGSFKGYGFGLSRLTLSGLPHFRESEFRAAFPLAEVRLRDPAFPGRASVTAFNPFIPLNDLDSSLPVAFFAVRLVNTRRAPIDYTVAFVLGNLLAGKTTNRLLQRDGVRYLHCTNDAVPEAPGYGDLALAADDTGGGDQACWYRGRWFDGLTVFWQDFSAPGLLKPRTYPEPGEQDHGVLSVRLTVAPGEEGVARFVLTWNSPNCRYEGRPDASDAAGRSRPWRNYYATRFADAVATADYALAQRERLERESRLFQETLFRSTLPAPVLDAVSANLSTLKTPTCLRLEDGSFYGWEGCCAETGCCEGTCTHVWNYAYALPFLFPTLERSVRELDYRHNLRPDGGMPFRLQLPVGSGQSSFRPCADGQFGNVIKVYRDWKICGDTAWLKALWPRVRRSLEFAWAGTNTDRWDPARTGVLYGRQHHTLDMELFGPNAWLTGFYLAALKAGAEMAEACGETAAAQTYCALFERGRDWIARHLFNGEYFVQRIDLRDRSILEAFAADDPAVTATYWSAEHGELKYQIAEGCGIDQVLAQWHADLAGLGEIFDDRQVRLALEAIHRYNYRPSMRDVVNPCRLYCVDDEAGTQMFTWPEGRRKPVVPVPYAQETMHGFEYQAASHMILRGLVAEGTALVKAVRDRYDGERRNPWNEVECGSHYARSMASYALLHSFSGFSFNSVRQELGFRPAALSARGRFRCFWCLATGWGEYEQDSARFALKLHSGCLPLRRLGLPLPPAWTSVRATLGRRPVPCRPCEGRLVFDNLITLRAGDRLCIQESTCPSAP